MANDEKNETEIGARLCENSDNISKRGSNSITGSSRRGHLEVVEMLLKGNANVSAEAAASQSRALQAAADGGHLEVVEILLTAEADVNAESAYREGRLALQAAAEGGYLEVVEMILTAKVDVDAEAITSPGRTALQAATIRGGWKTISGRRQKVDRRPWSVCLDISVK